MSDDRTLSDIVGTERAPSMLQIEQMAWEALHEYGLYAEGWRFRWDGASKRAGLCHHTQKVISLSRSIFMIEANRVTEARDTILHEIAHALVGPGAGHGPVWKAKARQLGCSPLRCHSMPTQSKYVGSCGCPGKEFSRQKPIKAGRRHWCKICKVTIVWRIR